MSIADEKGRRLSPRAARLWETIKPGTRFVLSGHPNAPKTSSRCSPDQPTYTQTATGGLLHWAWPHELSRNQAVRVQTFPDDYNFLNVNPIYVCGMSVPPRMMERVAGHVATQLLGVPMAAPPRTGPWRLSDLQDVPRNGLKVFSCFHCGGGSTMGYKLAGYDVLGGVEIDPQMMRLYRTNHRPRLSYLMGVREFAAMRDEALPRALFDLDVLDGSPPCSSFSMAGSREKAWGQKKVFREGQAHQVLDDLFFDFIAVAAKLQPKVVVAENVKGLLHGNARGYVKEIFAAFAKAGYKAQLFLLNASRMGVPQKRERTFFIANRMGGRINLDFNEPVISLREAWGADCAEEKGRTLPPSLLEGWLSAQPGEAFAGKNRQGVMKGTWRVHPDYPANTLLANQCPSLSHWAHPCAFSRLQAIRTQSFPDDYNFLRVQPGYVCGMSVPPRMMQRVAEQMRQQLLTL